MLAALAVLVAIAAAACGGDDDPAVSGQASTTTEAGSAATTATTVSSEPLVISAIPDQDPEKLARLYGGVADYLSDALGIAVEYEPVTDYAASVTLFRTGDLDMVWFGGLTGVQARLQVDGAQAIVQRDIDEAFHSVFIVNTSTGIEPFDDGSGLSALEGLTFTFGSESSTSGRLMPQHFLAQAGVTLDDFAGQPGFSGAHDATIALVESGSFQAGVLNEQVWEARVASGDVDTSRVRVVYRTPAYHDYHWVIRPDAASRYGADFLSRLTGVFTALDPADAEHAAILDLFGAERFIPTTNDNYQAIEEVGRQIGLIG